MTQLILLLATLLPSCYSQFGVPIFNNFDYEAPIGAPPLYSTFDYGPNIPPPILSPSMSYSTQAAPVGCGQTRGFFPSSRVVGGRKAMDNEFPWQVSIEMNKHDDKEPRQFCGGTIINEEWVLTAAHCVQGMKRDNLKLEIGSNDLTDDQSVSITFGDVLIHEDYDNSSMRNDIALVRTQKRIPLDVRSREVEINAICLPKLTDDFKGRSTVTGFGFQEEEGEGSSEMRATEVMILPSSMCQDTYDSFDPTIMLCAGWPEGGRDACQGDSGGPLVQKQPLTGNSVLVGVVSFGKGCARQDSPGVYTRVSAYVEWINNKIAQYNNNDI